MTFPFMLKEKGLKGASLQPKQPVKNVFELADPPFGLGVADSGIEVMVMSRLYEQFLSIKTDKLYKHIKPIEIYRPEFDKIEDFLLMELNERKAQLVMKRDYDGNIIGFEEELRSESYSADSIENRPLGKDFVRGSSSGVPFIAMKNRGSIVDVKALKTIPPGLDRGLLLSSLGDEKKNDFIKVSKLFDFEPENMDQNEEEPKEEEAEEKKAFQTDLLSTVRKATKATKAPEKTNIFAHMVDANSIPLDFDKVVPQLAFDYPFELDPFQKQAVYHLERGESVFVAAHTSAGKTVVAEYAIALATKHMTKAIYTSPIKALSNQKFRDFQNTFGDVGLLTGDIQLKPEASCLIMTTEILRSMLYRGADLIRDVEFVIFDEVHYVNDQERGVVWEEVIIMLPPHISLILLSATIPNTFEFADWVGRTKQKDIYVVSTLKRPVPLEHFLYVSGDLFKIVDPEKKFLSDGYSKAQSKMMGGKEKIASAPKKDGKTVVAKKNPYSKSAGDDKNLWVNLIQLLKKKSLLPVVVFTFSKKRCEENVDSLGSIDLTSSSEKSAIHVFFEKSVSKLKEVDRDLPQILRMKDLLVRGLAVHHSGLLPIMKEAVEILFSKGLVRVLFATETFAMGVNMPARTVVFSDKRKHDGTSFRDLLAGEYTQMAGRAGRRGLDSTGIVILVCKGDFMPSESNLKQLMLGTPTKLSSQFRLTFTMILNLLRVESLQVEDMIKKSFSENSTQKSMPQNEVSLAEQQEKLLSMKAVDCKICSIDLENFCSFATKFHLLSSLIYSALWDRGLSKGFFTVGRVIIINNHLYRNSPAVITKLKPLNAAFSCLVLTKDEIPQQAYLPLTFVNISGDKVEMANIQIADVIHVTPLKLKLEENESMNSVGMMLRSSLKKADDLFSLEIPKTKDFEIDSKIVERARMLEMGLLNHLCLNCPDLNEHYSNFMEEKMLKDQMAELTFKISDANLTLMPDYNARIQLLKRYGYIDENCTVQLKGRVACEINTMDEIIATELLMDNEFKDYEPAEIIALLSCMVFQERGVDEDLIQLTPRLQQGKKKIIEMATSLVHVQRELGMHVDLETFLGGFRFGLVQVVYEWARGMPFKQITNLTSVLEGSIVRTIVRLDESCREMRNAARTIGDLNFYRKIEAAGESIKRDICFASSLYL